MDTNENPRAAAEPRLAVDDLVVVELGAHGLGGTSRRCRQHGQKGPVAAAVIEHPAAPKRLRERQAGLEPAAVTPGNQPVLAEDLLGGVVALTEGGRSGFSAQGSGIRTSVSRASQLPRAVIQNERRISRRSSSIDCRRI